MNKQPEQEKVKQIKTSDSHTSRLGSGLQRTSTIHHQK